MKTRHDDIAREVARSAEFYRRHQDEPWIDPEPCPDCESGTRRVYRNDSGTNYTDQPFDVCPTCGLEPHIQPARER